MKFYKITDTKAINLDLIVVMELTESGLLIRDTTKNDLWLYKYEEEKAKQAFEEIIALSNHPLIAFTPSVNEPPYVPKSVKKALL